MFHVKHPARFGSVRSGPVVDGEENCAANVHFVRRELVSRARHDDDMSVARIGTAHRGRGEWAGGNTDQKHQPDEPNRRTLSRRWPGADLRIRSLVSAEYHAGPRVGIRLPNSRRPPKTGRESGVGSQESGVRSRESGVRSQESGVRSQEPGTGNRAPGAGRRASGAGRREPGAGRRDASPMFHVKQFGTRIGGRGAAAVYIRTTDLYSGVADTAVEEGRCEPCSRRTNPRGWLLRRGRYRPSRDRDPRPRGRGGGVMSQ